MTGFSLRALFIGLMKYMRNRRVDTQFCQYEGEVVYLRAPQPSVFPATFFQLVERIFYVKPVSNDDNPANALVLCQNLMQKGADVLGWPTFVWQETILHLGYEYTEQSVVTKQIPGTWHRHLTVLESL